MLFELSDLSLLPGFLYLCAFFVYMSVSIFVCVCVVISLVTSYWQGGSVFFQLAIRYRQTHFRPLWTCHCYATTECTQMPKTDLYWSISSLESLRMHIIIWKNTIFKSEWNTQICFYISLSIEMNCFVEMTNKWCGFSLTYYCYYCYP